MNVNPQQSQPTPGWLRAGGASTLAALTEPTRSSPDVSIQDAALKERVKQLQSAHAALSRHCDRVSGLTAAASRLTPAFDANQPDKPADFTVLANEAKGIFNRVSNLSEGLPAVQMALHTLQGQVAAMPPESGALTASGAKISELVNDIATLGTLQTNLGATSKALASELQKAWQDFSSPVSKGTLVNLGAMTDELKAIVQKYSGTAGVVLSGLTPEAAQRLATQTGLSVGADGTSLVINLDGVNSTLNHLLDELKQSGGMFGSYLMPPAEVQQLQGDFQHLLSNFNGMSSKISQCTAQLHDQIKELLKNRGTHGPVSSYDIDRLMALAIGKVNDSYLKPWQELAQNVTGFYNDLCSQIQNQMSACIKDGSDSNHMKIDAKTLGDSINTFLNTHGGAGATSYPVLTGLSPADATAFAKAAGLTVGADGTSVCIDLAPIKDMQKALADLGTPDGTGMINANSAAVQAFQSEISSNIQVYQSQMQQTVQAYGQGNSTFDNLNKILGSLIQALLDTDKTFLKT